MKTIFLEIALAVFVVGCTSSGGPASLKPLGSADTVQVHDNIQKPLFIGTITNADQVEKLVSFVDSLPQKWSVPWYGPPVGKIYFDFNQGTTNIGNFYVGPNFFGRDIYFGDGSIEFYSQSANENQIKQVGEIVGFDVWKYVHEP